MIVCDTNVLSELMKPLPNPVIEHWVASQPATSMFVTTITQAEILYGIALLPCGAIRDTLKEAVLVAQDRVTVTVFTRQSDQLDYSDMGFISTGNFVGYLAAVILSATGDRRRPVNGGYLMAAVLAGMAIALTLLLPASGLRQISRSRS